MSWNEFEYTALNGLQQEKFGTQTSIYHKQRHNSRGRQHSSITLTMDTYSHVLPDMQQGASDKLERILFTKTGTQ